MTGNAARDGGGDGRLKHLRVCDGDEYPAGCDAAAFWNASTSSLGEYDVGPSISALNADAQFLGDIAKARVRFLPVRPN